MLTASHRYLHSTDVKNNPARRTSFNALAQKTFGIDFSGWHDAGCWGSLYIPHVLLDGDRVVSNVSVNRMQFERHGVTKHYIQLGTVMTDEACRGQGLNRWLIEHVLAEYRDKVDGLYLFANDSVLGYYPRFGFVPAKEYEYYLPCFPARSFPPYQLEPVDMSQPAQRERLYAAIRRGAASLGRPNPNDALYMSTNLGLYQFWFLAEYSRCLYFLPELQAYLVARTEGQRLRLEQVFGQQRVDLNRLACSFGAAVEEVTLGYTPARRDGLSVREHKEEDTTLFIWGGGLRCIEQDRLRFPALSHA